MALSQPAQLPPLTPNPAEQPLHPDTQQQSDAMPGEAEATNTPGSFGQSYWSAGDQFVFSQLNFIYC